MDLNTTLEARDRSKRKMATSPSSVETGTTALGWTSLGFVLFRELGFADVGLILVTLALAELAAIMLVSGWTDLLEESAGRADGIWQSAVGAVMLRWLALSIAVVSASSAGFMPFFANQPMSVLALVGLPLLIAILHLTAACRAALSYRPSWLRRGRYVLMAVSVMGITYSDAPDVALVLLLAVLSCLLVLPFSLTGLPSLFREAAKPHAVKDVAQRCFLGLGSILARNIDLVMLPWLLPHAAAAVFLIARGLASGIGFASDQMQRSAFSTISSLNMQGPPSAFYAAAARLNLGLLLVGGGSAVAVMAVSNFATSYLSGELAHLSQVVFWLALGRCDIAIFGAAPLLMEVSAMRRTRATLSWIAALSLATVLSLSGVNQVVQMAQFVAIGQLSFAATCAFALGQRCGIWPGLTALFHQRIKLF